MGLIGNKTIAENIRKYRKIKGITQKELAQKLGVTVITIQNYENNRRNPGIEVLNEIAKALNINTYELFDLQENKSKPINLGKIDYDPIEYVRKLHFENPKDDVISEIVKRLDLNNGRLEQSDIEKINSYKSAETLSSFLDGLIVIPEIEHRSFEIFQGLLQSWGYNENGEIGSSMTYLYKKIKEQLELELKFIKFLNVNR